MARDEEVRQFSAKEAERQRRREKKQRPKMQVSGRSVFELARLIQHKGKK